MADTTSEAPVAATPKKAKAAKPKKPKTAPSHPKVSEMVNEAIANLKERGGSSLQAIKKYIGANFKVDVEKLSSFIKKYLKSAVVSGTLVQTKGKGATGSFRLSGAAGGEKPAPSKKRTTAKAATPKKSAAKKVAKPKKAAAKKATPKKSKPAAKAKATPKKPKAAAKPKAAKKPKKAKSTPKKAKK